MDQDLEATRGRPAPVQCLAIAGSDSGGGAGIQADLKTFAAHGVYGLSVLTAVTAQNTLGVVRSFELPAQMVRSQLEAVFGDFQVSAAKTGMLSSALLVREVVSFWRTLRQPPPLVVDPVMAAKSGHPLLSPEAVDVLRAELIPLATLVAPNRREAEILSGTEIGDRSGVEEAGRRILALGPRAVLLKGGHLDGNGFDPTRAVDFLIEAGGVTRFSAERIATDATHGTGCTYSAAICAWLGRGVPMEEAVRRAKVYVTGAIRHGLAIGRGHGPTDHFYFLERPQDLHGSAR